MMKHPIIITRNGNLIDTTKYVRVTTYDVGSPMYLLQQKLFNAIDNNEFGKLKEIDKEIENCDDKERVSWVNKNIFGL